MLWLLIVLDIKFRHILCNQYHMISMIVLNSRGVKKTLVHKNINSLFIYYEVVTWETESDCWWLTPYFLKPRCDRHIQRLASFTEAWYRAGSSTQGPPPPWASMSTLLTADPVWPKGRKSLSSYTFLTPTHFCSGAIHVIFLRSFVYLKTQVHILFTKSTLTVSQRLIYTNCM